MDKIEMGVEEFQQFLVKKEKESENDTLYLEDLEKLKIPHSFIILMSKTSAMAMEPYFVFHLKNGFFLYEAGRKDEKFWIYLETYQKMTEKKLKETIEMKSHYEKGLKGIEYILKKERLRTLFIK